MKLLAILMSLSLVGCGDFTMNNDVDADVDAPIDASGEVILGEDSTCLVDCGAPTASEPAASAGESVLTPLPIDEECEEVPAEVQSEPEPEPEPEPVYEWHLTFAKSEFDDSIEPVIEYCPVEVFETDAGTTVVEYHGTCDTFEYSFRYEFTHLNQFIKYISIDEPVPEDCTTLQSSGGSFAPIHNGASFFTQYQCAEAPRTVSHFAIKRREL